MKEIPKEIIEEELKIAKKRLKTAELLFQNNLFEDCINRAYYSIFYAGLKIIKEKLIPPKYSVVLRRAYEMRESSDYGIGIIFEKEEVKELLKEASDFLKIAEKFVKERL